MVNDNTKSRNRNSLYHELRAVSTQEDSGKEWYYEIRQGLKKYFGADRS